MPTCGASPEAATSLVAAADDAWTSFDLGLGADVTNLGAVKEPGLEALIASEPDLILASCNTAANLELLDTFEAAGLCVAYFDVQTLDDYLNMLGICTTLTGCEENYELNGSAVRAQADAAIARQTGEAPTVLCIRATGVSCKVKGSRDFVLGEMLADLGCVNIADSEESLLEDLSLEAIIAAEPDYIFAVLQGSDPTDAMETLSKLCCKTRRGRSCGPCARGVSIRLSTSSTTSSPTPAGGRPMKNLQTSSIRMRTRPARLFAALAAVCLAACCMSLALGPVNVPLPDLLRALFSGEAATARSASRSIPACRAPVDAS